MKISHHGPDTQVQTIASTTELSPLSPSGSPLPCPLCGRGPDFDPQLSAVLDWLQLIEDHARQVRDALEEVAL